MLHSISRVMVILMGHHWSDSPSLGQTLDHLREHILFHTDGQFDDPLEV